MHLITVNDLASKEVLEGIFEVAEELRGVSYGMPARGKVMGIIKDEGSTRTRVSFEVAMKRLGGEVVILELDKTSSAIKGESLEDTVRVMSEYVDLIVMRHSQKGIMERVTGKSLVPVINAGDGDGEHPTQALLDLYTMWRKFGKIDGLRITMAGDLKYSRTIHSLVNLLKLYKDIKIHLVSDYNYKLSDEYLHSEISWSWGNNLAGGVREADVIYMTREQKERGGGGYDEYPRLTKILMDSAKESCMVMHPLPRCKEIDIELDEDPRSCYFEQVKNGMYIRMALIYNLFNNYGICNVI